MANILDYIAWRGDLDFSEAPFCEVDNLVLSLLSYFDFSGLVPESPQKSVTLSQAAGQYFRLRPWTKNSLGVLFSDQYRELLEKAAGCRRFGSILPWGQVNRIDEELEMQFSATCFSLGSGETFVAFRGTDDTIVGWKEDFNMTVLFPIPAQQQAALYLDRTSRETGDRLILGGHSKGGNLAVYAAAFCSPQTRRRIDSIWSNDGPGFFPNMLTSPEYLAVRDRIRSVLPRSSIIGVFLDSDCETIPVESSTVGPLQHDGLSWQVLGPRFVRAAGLSKHSRQADRTLHMLVEEMALGQRKLLIDTLFSACDELGIKTLTELVSEKNKLHRLHTIYTKFSAFDKQTRDTFFRTLLATFRQNEELIQDIQ